MPFLGKDERLILALNFLMVEVLAPTCTSALSYGGDLPMSRLFFAKQLIFNGVTH